ncbi:MAG: hypothetical protein KDH96_02340 [Candidatus Riesia sp.]|nr:hypothetical protein [Candidatus Riesia sp.]
MLGLATGGTRAQVEKSITKAKENERAVLEAFARSGHADKDRIESLVTAEVGRKFVELNNF